MATAVDSALPREVYPLMKKMRDAFEEIMTILQQDEDRVRKGYMLLQKERDDMVHEISAWHAQRPEPILPNVERRHHMIPADYQNDPILESTSSPERETAFHRTSPPKISKSESLQKQQARSSLLTGAVSPKGLGRRGTEQFESISTRPHSEGSGEQRGQPRTCDSPRCMEAYSEASSDAYGHFSPREDSDINRSRLRRDGREAGEEGAWRRASSPDYSTSELVQFRSGYDAAARVSIRDQPDCHKEEACRTRVDAPLSSLPAIGWSGTQSGPQRSAADRPAAFWIHVWPCFGTYTSTCSAPERVFISRHCRYMEDVTEVASKVLQCQPAPTYLYEPDGHIVREIACLKPEQHYLLFPSGGRYQEASVPVALLERLVAEAQLAVLDQGMSSRPWEL